MKIRNDISLIWRKSLAIPELKQFGKHCQKTMTFVSLALGLGLVGYTYTSGVFTGQFGIIGVHALEGSFEAWSILNSSIKLN